MLFNGSDYVIAVIFLTVDYIVCARKDQPEGFEAIVFLVICTFDCSSFNFKAIVLVFIENCPRCHRMYMLWCRCFLSRAFPLFERTRTKNSNIIKSTKMRIASAKGNRQNCFDYDLWTKKSIVRRPLQGEEERKIGNARFHPSILEEPPEPVISSLFR